MEKRRFGPKLKMNGLPKATQSKVLFHSLPKAIETTFETGYGPDNNLKWEMDITLLEHPTQAVTNEGMKMVWQTTASVVRDELMYLVNKSSSKELPHLLKDLKSCEWNIVCDANGLISIEEI
jgi:hypothetical protein